MRPAPRPVRSSPPPKPGLFYVDFLFRTFTYFSENIFSNLNAIHIYY